MLRCKGVLSFLSLLLMLGLDAALAALAAADRRPAPWTAFSRATPWARLAVDRLAHRHFPVPVSIPVSADAPNRGQSATSPHARQPAGRRARAARAARGTRASVLANGYPLEAHKVRTDDGYLLGVFRIPQPGRPIVLLMHGLLLSSADYVTLGRRRALPFVLHDAGLDVWMCNARGNMESRRHDRKHPDEPAFWDFSWHEIGVHDVPSCIDYALAATNQTALHYVGHSQGSTTFLVMGSERPVYMSKIKSFVALAPVAFIKDIRSDLIRLFGQLDGPARLRRMGAVEVFPNTHFLSALKQVLCSPGAPTQPLCFTFLFLLSGFDSPQVNATMLPAVYANFPAGSSMKQLEHFGQQLEHKDLVFRKFDYRARGNLARYGEEHAPDYNLSRITPPTHIFHSDNDILSVQSNVDALMHRLPNIVSNGLRRVSLAAFNHLDFVFGRDAKELVYDHVLACIRRHETRLQTEEGT